VTLVTQTTMRERFYETAAELIDRNDRVAIVIAEIGGSALATAKRRHPDRVINVGIREQLMVGVAGGLALAGFRPIAHSYAPFIVERPFEMLKLDLGHQDAGAILVSVGASYDSAASGRTHQSPEDVALVAALPGWRIFVPGHADEAELLLRAAAADSDRVYLRLTEQSNAVARPIEPGRFRVERRGRDATVIVVGPLLDSVLEATADLDVTVLYATTVRPFDRKTLRSALSTRDVILVEPYLAGTSSSEVAEALLDKPHRLLALGVANTEHRRYGTWREHNAAHGLDAAGIRARVVSFLAA
jgi:transketolase